MAIKIKKSVPKKPISSGSLLDFIKQDKKVQAEKDRIKKKENSTTFSNPKKPSQNGNFVKWKKKDIEKWSCWDFIGLYLTTYVEKCDEEDADFCNRKSTYKFGVERGILNRFKKLYFEEDNKGLEKYIKFMFDWWMSEESFVDGYPMFRSIFSPKATFYKIFKESQNKFNKKKVIKKRKDIDNDFASKDMWDSYFDEKEDKGNL